MDRSAVKIGNAGHHEKSQIMVCQQQYAQCFTATTSFHYTYEYDFRSQNYVQSHKFQITEQ